MQTANFLNQPSFISLFPPAKDTTHQFFPFSVSFFKASFQFWQDDGLRLDTLWYKQESDRAHKEPAWNRSQKLMVRNTALPTPVPAVPEDGGMGGSASPTHFIQSPGLGTIPPSCNRAILSLTCGFLWGRKRARGNITLLMEFPNNLAINWKNTNYFRCTWVKYFYLNPHISTSCLESELLWFGMGMGKRPSRLIRSQLSAAPPNLWIHDMFTFVICH